MEKEIKILDSNKGVIRVTVEDGRAYYRMKQNLATGLPELEWKPSVTWIVGCYPKASALKEWRESVGKDEADRRLREGGARGSKVHYACEDWDNGNDINTTTFERKNLSTGEVETIKASKYENPNTRQLEELTAEEVRMVLNYQQYRKDNNVQLLANELVVFGDVYAGTVDKIWAAPTIHPDIRQIEIVDLKTSKSISREYEMQQSAYSHADIDYKSLGITDEEWANRKLKILRLDFGVNHRADCKEVEDCYGFFRNSVYPVWEDLHKNWLPEQFELPLKIDAQYAREQIEAKRPQQSSPADFQMAELNENSMTKVELNKMRIKTNKLKK